MTGRFAVMIVALALAGCSGGGSGGAGAGDPGGDPPGDGGGDGDGGDDGGGGLPEEPGAPDPASDSYAIRRAQLTQLRARMVSETGEVPTAVSTLPVSGQAVYSGYLAAGLEGAGLGERDLLGDVSLVASFGDGTIAGRIDNFRRADETPVRGSLEIRRAGLRRSSGSPGFSGALEGRLTDGVGAIGVEGTASGTFYGEAGGYIAGDVSARVTTNEGTGRMGGDFVAE